MQVSDQLHTPVVISLGKEQPVFIGWEAGWALEPTWTLWRREKFLASVGNQTTAFQLITSGYTH
jgi:hypothetical protein